MKLNANEEWFLTALAREQNQAGCRGPAHELLRRYAYPDAPRSGPGSLVFAYEVVPLTGLLFKDQDDLQALDDFLRRGEPDAEPGWPWDSAAQFRDRLQEARRFWEQRGPARSKAANGGPGPQSRPVSAQAVTPRQIPEPR